MTPAAAVVPVRDANLPASWVHRADGTVHRDVSIADLVTALAEPATMVWVDIDTTKSAQVALLEKVFKFHPLAIEDTLNPNSRVKLDEYDDHLFAIVRGVEFDRTTEDPLDLVTFNLCFFLGRNLLVTTHARPIPAVEVFRTRCEASAAVLAHGPARAMYAIMDASTDAYFPVLDEVNGFIDTLEERVFERYDDEVLQDIFAVKRTVLSLRRHLAPQREVMNALTNRPQTLLTLEEQRYFRDVYDHVLRINDALEQYRDLLSTVLDASLTQTSVRLGMVTKGLTVVATISVPFVVVSGMWGMNFTSVPLSDSPYGFWMMLVIQLGLGVGLLVYLRRNGWL
jgi:magnesium transporter